MDNLALLSFMMYVMVNAFTPGPGNILALSTMTQYGWKAGKPLFFGVFLGYFVVQALCALFVFGLNEYLSTAIDLLKYIGAAYIAWLAISVILSKPSDAQSSKQPSFWVGFTLQFVNVKIFLFGITALTAYVLPFYQSLDMFLFFEAIIAIVGTIATLTWIMFGAILQHMYTSHFRLINLLLGAVLLECAYELLMT